MGNRKTTGETNNKQVGDGNESCNRKPTRRTEVPQEASSKQLQEWYYGKIPRSVWYDKRNPIAGVPTIEGRDIEFVRATRNSTVQILTATTA
jgi:hypothetical protein